MGPSEQTPAVDRMPPHGTLAAQTDYADGGHRAGEANREATRRPRRGPLKACGGIERVRQNNSSPPSRLEMNVLAEMLTRR